MSCADTGDPRGQQRGEQRDVRPDHLRDGRGSGRHGSGRDGVRDVAGGWLLGCASALLLALALAQGYVSFRAQYHFVHQIKGEKLASMLEAAGLDAAAVIFALLALAQARFGRPALAERILNLACVGGSLAMNAASATLSDPKSVVAWVLPALLYAAASDRLIAVVRRRALARKPGADNERSAYAALGSAGLWLLRLILALPSTFFGFRAWVIATAPVAPGLRPGSPARPHQATTPDAVTQSRPNETGEAAGLLPDPDGRTGPAPPGSPGSPGQASSPGRSLAAASGPPALARSYPANGSKPYGSAMDPTNGPVPSPSPTVASRPANGSGGNAPELTAGSANGHVSGGGGPSKRAVLIRLYDEAGAAGDPRHHTREGVGPLAKELHHQAGLAQRSTARNYLHDLLDQRGIPRRSTDNTTATNTTGTNAINVSTSATAVSGSGPSAGPGVNGLLSEDSRPDA